MPDQPAILYIEDNRDNQRLVQRVLGARGFNVQIAEDGPSGIQMARESNPDLILVDMGIPGLDGYETTTRLRGLPHLNKTPIVALTADGTTGARERALVAGCNGFLSKPIDTRRLPTQIEEYIGGKQESVPVLAEAQLLREHSQKLVQRLEHQVRELSLANAELQELDRLKDLFLATLSHELRTPLTSLSGYIELFERETLGPLNTAQREAMSVMRRSTETLSKQLNNLLFFQELRQRQMKLLPIKLHEHLQGLLDALVERATMEGQRLDLVIEPTESIMADGAAIELLVQNLIDNAIKFNRPNGRIRFTLRDEPRRVIMRVEDTGIGIPTDALEKIFLPFFQIESSLGRSHVGSGLGLAIVRHIIDAHQGQVVARSNPGQGSAFTLVLPRM